MLSLAQTVSKETQCEDPGEVAFLMRTRVFSFHSANDKTLALLAHGCRERTNRFSLISGYCITRKEISQCLLLSSTSKLVWQWRVHRRFYINSGHFPVLATLNLWLKWSVPVLNKHFVPNLSLRVKNVLQLGSLKMQDMKMKDQVASHENAGQEHVGHENATHRQFTRCCYKQ